MAVDQDRLLKVLSGPHLGAEIVLSDGEYLLGRGERCDIILDDAAMAEEHAKLIVRGREVFCSSLGESPVYIDGQEASDAQLEPFQFLTLGHTHLAYGPSHANWPVRDFPVIQVVDQKLDQVNTDERETAEPDNSKEEPELSNQASSAVADGNSQHSKARWFVAVAMIVVLFGGGFLVLNSAIFSDGADDVVTQVSREDLMKIVTEYAAGSTVEIMEDGDGYIARGYVGTKDVARKLEDSLLQVDNTIDTAQIWDTESIAYSIRSFLAMRKLRHLAVELGDPGQIIVSGKTPELSIWEKVKNEIEQRTKVGVLVDHVTTPDGKSTLSKEPIASLTPQSETPTGANVDVPAGVKSNQPDSKTPSQTPDTPPKSSLLPFLVRDLTIGRSKFFTTDSGVDVYENSFVTGGYYVKSIESDKIIFSKDGKDFVVNVGKTK